MESIFDQDTIGAISSSLIIILLGFYLTKNKIFSESFAKTLSTVILVVGLPALSFTSFMKDINEESLRNGINILIWGFIFQGGLIFLLKGYYYHYKKDEKQALVVLTTLGSTTFFGIPIISAVYGTEGVLYASIFNISYRIYLYSWGYISFSGLKMDKSNLKTMLFNPIIIATFLGLFIWFFQAMLPQVKVGSESFAFLRIDKTAYWLFRPMEYLANICSPLAWLSIGGTLAKISMKEAVTNTTVWFYTFTKIIVVPILGIAGLYVMNMITPISFLTVAVSTIMMATPPATVAVSYAIKFDRQAVLSSNCSLISTVTVVFLMPVLIVLLGFISSLKIFL